MKTWIFSPVSNYHFMAKALYSFTLKENVISINSAEGNDSSWSLMVRSTCSSLIYIYLPLHLPMILQQWGKSLFRNHPQGNWKQRTTFEYMKHEYFRFFSSNQDIFRYQCIIRLSSLEKNRITDKIFIIAKQMIIKVTPDGWL